MTYTVLRPLYVRTGEVTTADDGKALQWERVAKWVPVGFADSVEDAKRRYSPVQYGYALVLAENEHA